VHLFNDNFIERAGRWFAKDGVSIGVSLEGNMPGLALGNFMFDEPLMTGFGVRGALKANKDGSLEGIGDFSANFDVGLDTRYALAVIDLVRVHDENLVTVDAFYKRGGRLYFTESGEFAGFGIGIGLGQNLIGKMIEKINKSPITVLSFGFQKDSGEF
jgi:hypothetical protein